MTGGYLTVSGQFAADQIGCLVPLGAGFLVGVTLFEMIPHAVHHSDHAPVLVAAGYFAILAIEYLMPSHGPNGRQRYHVPAVLTGLLVHTFLDGAAIAAAYLGAAHTGPLLILSLILHKLPEGFSLATVALACGFSRFYAMAATALLALSTLAGTAAGLLWGAQHPREVGGYIALTAGSLLYIGFSGMGLGGRRPLVHILLVITGAALVRGLAFLLHRVGLH